MRPGRHSGILIPQFGINDLVRPTRGYNRQVTNIGYYWAPNDYLDFTGRLDWFANRYVQYGVTGAVPLARPVRERARWASTSSARWAEARGSRSGGTTGRRSTSPPASTSTSTTPATRGWSGRTRSTRCRTPSRSAARSTSPSATAGAPLTLGGNRRQDITDGGVQQLLPALTRLAGADRARRRHHLVAGPQPHQQHHLRPRARLAASGSCRAARSTPSRWMPAPG